MSIVKCKKMVNANPRLKIKKFFIKSPGLPVRAPNLPGNTYRGLFQNVLINFIILEMSKRKIKQEVDLVLLFELFSTEL